MALATRVKTCDVDTLAFKGMALAEAILRPLAQKGFAVLDANADDDLLRGALREAKRLEDDGRFEMPPPQIVAGLLGEEGSAAVCDRVVAPAEGEASGKLPHLCRADSYLTDLATTMLPLLGPELGLTVESRTTSMLHRAGEAFDEEPAYLTEAAADAWLTQFVNHRLMLLYFLGPGEGLLELQPFHHTDTPAHKVTTQPGTVVVLRADSLLHSFSAQRVSYSLTCWLNQDSLDAERRDYSDDAVVPCARALMKWIMQRLKELKNDEVMTESGPVWNESIPRHWQSTMNHMYFKGPQTAVRSVASHFPSGWDTFASWSSLNVGVDYAVTIPLARWDHEPSYDPNPESWRYARTCVRHATFMEGSELFETKVFGLSIFEAKAMDPCQRQVLESSYEALIQGGLTKKTLMRSIIGCFIGAAATEFSLVPMEDGGTATSCAGAITSNRISFCLGMQGPSFTLDIGGASSLGALAQSTNNLRYQTEDFKPCHSALSGSVNLTLAAAPIVIACACGLMNPAGRCFTFDVSASGYMKGEGTACMLSTKLTETVDGEEVQDEGKPMLGIIGAISLNHGGASAHLTSPNGPQHKELIHRTVRQAQISPLDVDAVECHGDGSIMSDGLEATVVGHAYRGDDQSEPIFVGAVTTNMGHGMESSGMYQVMKILTMQRYGVQTTGIGLSELNPVIQVLDGEPTCFLTENLNFKHVSSFVGMTGRSYTGTMVHCIPWKNVEWRSARPRRQVIQDAIAFWPAGGGELEDDSAPPGGYTIMGSWSEWAPEKMVKESRGVYRFTVTLGVNRFEHFQIYQAGSYDQVLHPGFPDAGPNVAISGPDESANCEGFNWMLDGRQKYEIIGAEADEEEGPGIEGWPGDVYHVRLHIAGKWRTVDWARDDTGIAERQKRWDAYVDGGAYYVCASWNNWGFTKMAKEGDVYSLSVNYDPHYHEFAVVRNQDVYQAFYVEPDGAVVGPTYMDATSSCRIQGRPGEAYRIEFARSGEEATLSYRPDVAQLQDK